MESNVIITANNSLICVDPSTSWEIDFIGIDSSPHRRGENTICATPIPIGKHCKKIGVGFREKKLKVPPLQMRKGAHLFVKAIMAISFSQESTKAMAVLLLFL